MAERDSETQEFLKKIEETHGGKIDKKTFSLWYGDSEGNIREFGVFIYRINGVYHYEDFKRRASILGFTVPDKKADEYVKFERSFTFDEIESTLIVKKASARKYIETGKAIKKAGFIARLLLDTVLMVQFKDSTVKFFQLVEKDFFD